MAQEAVAPYPPQGWWHRHVAREADKDRLRTGERIGNIIGMFFIVLVALIFIDIQIQDYGFFTGDFGLPEQLLFYGSLLYGLVPAFVRAATGRRNLGRLFDLFGSVLFIVAAAYLLVTFPFDFTQLFDFLPSSVRPSFSWFNNDLVRFFFELAIFITAISLVYNAVLYLSIRRELRARRAAGTAN